MNKKNLLIAAIALVLSACASNVENPIGTEVMTGYRTTAVNVTLTDGKKIPDRYDEAAQDYLNTAATDSEKTTFQAFAEGLETSADGNEDYTGEAFLTWLVQRRLDRRARAMLQGDTEATLEVELKSTTWPNTATMMLVGEMIGTQFEFNLKDNNDEPIVESIGTLSPFVERSAGGGGGLLGLALRSGSSQHITDMERVADATAALVMSIMTAPEVPKATLKNFKYKGTTASEISGE